MSERKASGATYTPRALADYLAERLIESAPGVLAQATIRVLDPALGDGALALALATRGKNVLLIEVEGQSGAGLVKITMTCKQEVRRVTIDPSLLADDKDMLEDLVAAAFNAAVRKAEETSQEKMGKLTAGMPGLPGGMKFPF